MGWVLLSYVTSLKVNTTTSAKYTKIKCNTMFLVWWKTKIEWYTPGEGYINIAITVRYCLNKQEFCDLAKWGMVGYYHSYQPSSSAELKRIVQHALSCIGDFVTLRHNHVRNITAELLSQVTKDVKIELVPQSLTGKTFEQRTANTSDDARLNVRARRFLTK